jgi:hypothetical protein
MIIKLIKKYYKFEKFFETFFLLINFINKNNIYGTKMFTQIIVYLQAISDNLMNFKSDYSANFRLILN